LAAGDRLEAAFAREERRGLMMATTARSASVVVILGWLAVANPEHGAAYAWVLGTAAFLLVSGLIQLWLYQRRAALDALLADKVTRRERILLKLDLEGHELHALAGAERVLRETEVALTELQFYEIDDNGCPGFHDVLSFFQERGFELYDFACLFPRPRDGRLRTPGQSPRG